MMNKVKVTESPFWDAVKEAAKKIDDARRDLKRAEHKRDYPHSRSCYEYGDEDHDINVHVARKALDNAYKEYNKAHNAWADSVSENAV